MWWKANDRYSITNGTYTLIIPYKQGFRGVNDVLKYLNSLEPRQKTNRICAKCNGPFRKHHKWHFNSDHKPEHYSCSEPTLY